jgi:hypothetical protein
MATPSDERSASNQADDESCKPTPVVGWTRVREILNAALLAWEQKNGRRPRLRAAHGDDFVGDHPFLGWETKQEIQQAVARIQDDPTDYRLIEPGKPARQTNLVLALTTGVPMDGGGTYPVMPLGGPAVLTSEVDELVAWIDAGMPD